MPGSVWAFRGRRRAGLRTCDICQTALACARSPCAASSGSALLSSHATRATVLGATLPRVVRALLAPRHVLPRTSLPRPPFFPALCLPIIVRLPVVCMCRSGGRGRGGSRLRSVVSGSRPQRTAKDLNAELDDYMQE